MPYGQFPATLIITPSSDLRIKTTVQVQNWDQVKNIQRSRYEILDWK